MNVGCTLLAGFWPLAEILISRNGTSLQDKEIRNTKRGAVKLLRVKYLIVYSKRKATPVTGRGRLYGCETSRFPHFLDNQLTDGGEVVSLTRRPPLSARRVPAAHFCERLRRPQGHSVAGRIRSTEKSSDLIGNRTRDLPACT
jgi:hypothetical protein